MRTSSQPRRRRILAALCTALLWTGAYAAPDATAPDATAAATAAATLDVCQVQDTGHWRYTGVVAVRSGAATDSSALRIAYWIQNRVSGTAYQDIVEAFPLALPLPGSAPSARWAPARVAAYRIDAPPLAVGTLRGMARVIIDDPLNPFATATGLAPSEAMNAPVCTCSQPKGCLRTRSYWGNKPGVAWPLPHRRGDHFHASAQTWQQILDTPPGSGNAYLILAHQTMATLLNKGAGASVPASIQNVLDRAAAWFSAGAGPDSCRAGGCELQTAWAGILDAYNHGQYPGAPAPCPD